MYGPQNEVEDSQNEVQDFWDFRKRSTKQMIPECSFLFLFLPDDRMLVVTTGVEHLLSRGLELSAALKTSVWNSKSLAIKEVLFLGGFLLLLLAKVAHKRGSFCLCCYHGNSKSLAITWFLSLFECSLSEIVVFFLKLVLVVYIYEAPALLEASISSCPLDTAKNLCFIKYNNFFTWGVL